MSEDDEQKTEDPTAKKLDEARKKGQVAVSRELNNWIMLTAATILIGTMAPSFMARLSEILKIYIEQSYALPQAPGGFSVVLGATYLKVLGIMAVPLIALMVAAFIGPFAQVGPLYSAESIKPELSKVSIIKGLGRLFSRKSLVEFLKGLLKFVVIGGTGYIVLRPYYDGIEHLVGMPIPLMLGEMMGLTMKMLIGMLSVLMVLAIIDVVWQRMEHMKQMRMSRQEIRDEHKQSEGDPHIKARLRQLRAEKARQRMMTAVPNADVIITNPTHYSIALSYKPDEMDAPVCVAKGVDEVALRIREVAKEHNVTIYEAPPLARALYATVDIDEMVPPDQYKAVAEVITFVFKLKGKMKQ